MSVTERQNVRGNIAAALGLDRKLNADEINALPLASYEGPIHFVRSPEEMKRAVRELEGERLLGFDTETKPCFRSGESHPPVLLQLAGRHSVYIFQLRDLGLRRELTEILSDELVVKAGVANSRDVKMLKELTCFEPRCFVDLGECAKACGMQHHGLRGLAALLLGKRISKGAKLTNWEQPNLSMRALVYAATDAWIGRSIYEVMKEHGCVS